MYLRPESSPHSGFDPRQAPFFREEIEVGADPVLVLDHDRRPAGKIQAGDEGLDLPCQGEKALLDLGQGIHWRYYITRRDALCQRTPGKGPESGPEPLRHPLGRRGGRAGWPSLQPSLASPKWSSILTRGGEMGSQCSPGPLTGAKRKRKFLSGQRLTCNLICLGSIPG